MDSNRPISDELIPHIKPKPSVIQPIIQINFLKDGVEYWSKKGREYVNCFEKGELISNYSSVSRYEHLGFFLRIVRLLEDVVRIEFLKRDKDFTDTKELFKILESTFKILSTQIETSAPKEHDEPKEKEIVNPELAKNNFDINLIFATFHGFITSYIQKQ